MNLIESSPKSSTGCYEYCARCRKALQYASIAIVLLTQSPACWGANPFITSIHTADPSAHVWSDGRLYVYPSHDMDPPRGCDLMDRYHVYSTTDMANWRDEGEILRASQVPWGRPEGGFMWAPDCAYRDGTYYFYFPHPSETRWNDTWKIGVATSTKPASNFKVVGYIEGLGGFAMIDPCVFVDTDGQAYIYTGGGSRCKGGKLKSNMIELEGETRDMTGLEDFHEAAWVFKRKGLYYLTYSDNKPKANRLRYATSSSPLGPWEHKGIYLEPTGCDTSHGSVLEFKGQWYAFYHNQSLSGRGNLRSICADKLEFNEDGTIQIVRQTREGVASVSPAPTPARDTITYQAESASVGEGAMLAADSAAPGGRCVQNLHLKGAFLEFANVDGGKSSGRAAMSIQFASAENAKLRLTVNGADYSFLNLRSTGGWTDYSGKAEFTVQLGAGKTNQIRLAGGNGGVNVDALSITPLH